MRRVEDLIAELASMANHSYGERVNMLDHSLQTAALARSEAASDELVLAALLHDIGHLNGDAGAWGLPSHAEVGAEHLHTSFSSEVTDPIRLHVDAKRYLVATDPSYAQALSKASVMSLAEQGGPFTAAEATRFEELPGAAAAIRLRRWDDEGKVAGLQIDGLDSYRELIERHLRPATDPAWARDSCRCADCRDPGNDQHLLDVVDVMGWSVVSEEVMSDHRVVVLERDGEVHRCEIPDGVAPAVARLWGTEHETELRADAANVSDTAAFASQLAELGICLVSNVPIESEAVLTFAESVGFVRETNYGRHFEVLALPDPNNLAYTSVGLPLHTDNPYREPCPTVQLLHCLAAAPTGGASQFADGFSAAERMRTEDPEAFEILTSTPLQFRFHDSQTDLRASRPMIELDVSGGVRAVSVNHRSMEPPDPASTDTDRFYRAYRRFTDLLKEGQIRLILQPGELVAFDNRRVLHGRSGFELTERRHLQGCYIDMDAIRSLGQVGRISDPAK